ncbi:tripartite tricarboxylate transporter substrate binding protein [Roseomonas sp. PWR1]|uniref:Tripartite tricarboxylate transporter substrate binding protein n=1 Tax=Roseomonas nitratireducens TaxID=2820810 RepID=A0ABS4ASP4_9PROT|nr:tripartite tricarboxylate transporter substrate binding protein [Neoroseomonas nitratireducens]MBP0464374.1 tripartite tricarboxylate transporter substrate binding protein [Neoroseomonas nitratireducens]
MTRIARRHLLATPALLAAAPALGQGAFTRPVRLIVPWAPGGTTDILARIVAEPLATALGQPVLVENRSGASGNVGSDLVAKAAPDGHTLLFGSMSTHAMNHALMRSMPFDGVADFTPLAMLGFAVNTMVIHPSVPAQSVPEFIAHARANPEKVAYASAGPGSTNHLCAALFESMTGIRMVHVPYRGGQPAVTDTVAGQTQLLFSAATQTMPHVDGGRLRLIGVTEAARWSRQPSIPTVGEAVPGYEMAVWYGAFGPKGMDPALQRRLNADLNRIMELPAVKDRLAGMGVEMAVESTDAFGRRLVADAEKWGALIRRLGIEAS